MKNKFIKMFVEGKKLGEPSAYIWSQGPRRENTLVGYFYSETVLNLTEKVLTDTKERFLWKIQIILVSKKWASFAAGWDLNGMSWQT